MFRLRLNEVKVLAYILDRMDYSGMFVLDIDECAAITCIHVRTVYKAIHELVRLDVIMKNTRSRYWVNPNIACKGSRDGMNLVFDDETNSSI
jgi:DNA-binding transcriptional regulator YhcF (GntR family)